MLVVAVARRDAGDSALARPSSSSSRLNSLSDNTRRHPLLPSAPPHPVAAAKPSWSSGHATNTQARPITSAARPTPVRLARGRPSRIIPPPLWSVCQTLNPRRLSRRDWPLGSHAKSDARRHRAHTTPGVEGVSCVACPSCACVAAPRPFRMPCQSDRHTHDHDARHIIIHVQPSIASDARRHHGVVPHVATAC